MNFQEEGVLARQLAYMLWRKKKVTYGKNRTVVPRSPSLQANRCSKVKKEIKSPGMLLFVCFNNHYASFDVKFTRQSVRQGTTLNCRMTAKMVTTWNPLWPME